MKAAYPVRNQAIAATRAAGTGGSRVGIITEARTGGGVIVVGEGETRPIEVAPIVVQVMTAKG